MVSDSPTDIRLGLRLTPHGRLLAEPADDATELDARIAARLAQASARGSGDLLLQLGAGEVGQPLPAAFSWWRSFAGRYVAALCLHAPASGNGAGGNSASQVLPKIAAPEAGELTSLLLTAPMMPGAEYLSADLLRDLWDATASACAAAYAASGTDLQGFLKQLNPAWNLVGRVHFNLAENRRDPEAPFAFMATYTTRLSAQAKAQHVPLGQALREYAGAANRDKLLSLLLPVQRAARKLCLAEGNDRRRRDLPSAALDAGGGVALPGQRAGAGTCRRGAAHAGNVARQPPGPPAGHGHRWGAQALRRGAGRAAGLPHGGHAGRRSPVGAGNPCIACRHRLPGAAARPVGGG